MWVMDKEDALNYILSENQGLMEYCGFSRTGETLQTRIPPDRQHPAGVLKGRL